MSVANSLIAELRALGDAQKAAEMAAYHKTAREFLGLSTETLEMMSREQRRSLSLEARCDLAQALWESDIHEARIYAAKLLSQARIRPDDSPVWRMIAAWAQEFDSWALADHASIAGGKRLIADPRRLDEVEDWTVSHNMWTRRAALVMTLPWARLAHPKPDDMAIRARVLGWAAGYVPDRDRFIQKAIAWWLRDLSRRDPQAVCVFLEGPGSTLSASAKREARRLITHG